MKLFGISFERPHFDVVTIQRGDKFYHFTCQAVVDNTEFEQKCPPPTPPIITFANGQTKPDFTSKAYKEADTKRREVHLAYIVIKSLQATDGLEWDLVNMDDPDTWCKWREDLKAGGLADFEINTIENTVFEVNSLSSPKIEEARKSFLAGLLGQQR